MTDHFYPQTTNKQNNTFSSEEEYIGKQTQNQTVYNNQNINTNTGKKHKQSLKIAPEKHISLYSLMDGPISTVKDKDIKNNIKNSSNFSNNNSSNYNNYGSQNTQVNHQTETKEYKPKKNINNNFESPMHTNNTNFKVKTGNSQTYKDKDKDKEREDKKDSFINIPISHKSSKQGELLSSPSIKTTTTYKMFNNALKPQTNNNSKTSNTNLPISTIPKACITSDQFMSPSSTTYKSIDSVNSQNSIYNLRKSEKSDDEGTITGKFNSNMSSLNNFNDLNTTQPQQNNLLVVNTNQLSAENNNSIINSLSTQPQAIINPSSNFVNRIINTNNTNNTNKSNNSNSNVKKSNDFKVKYKTEKCKFWEFYKECKYGDNVSNLKK